MSAPRALEESALWLTLDASPRDHQDLGARLEAWSCFSAAGFQFVAKLTAAERFDARTAYFAHARGWPSRDVGAGFDPAVLIGRSAAFEAPWRDAAERSPFEPDAQQLQPPAVPEQADLARALLGHLYQARTLGYPLVLAAPVSDFVTGGPLGPLAAFARAALPSSLKADCAVRIYTRNPALFLGSNGARLLVLPAEDAGQALAIRRDATVLDRSGAVVAGRPLQEPFATYADAVVGRALETPEALLHFSERVDGRPWSAGGASTADVAEVSFIYAVASKRTEADLEGLVRSLFATLEQRQIPVPWFDLLTPDDLARCGDDMLAGLLLRAPATPEAARLQTMLEREAVRRGLQLDGRFDAWWPSQTSPPVDRLLRLADARLLSEQRATRAIASVTADTIATRAVEGGLDTIIRLTEQGVVPYAWVEGALALASNEQVVQLATWLVRRRTDLAAERSLWAALDAMVEHNADVAPEFGQALLTLVHSLPRTDLMRRLTAAELMHRAQHAEAKFLVAQSVALATTNEQRREIASRVLNPRWRSMQTFAIDKQWQADVPDLLLQIEERKPAHDARWVLDLLARLHASDHESRERAFRLIDTAMGTDPAGTTDGLIGHDHWLTWRLRAPSGDITFVSAYHWLTSKYQPKQTAVRLEDWTQAAIDLKGALKWRDLENVLATFPRIPGFQERQLRDIAAMAHDLVGAALVEPEASEDALARIGQLAAEPRWPQLVSETLEWARERGFHGISATVWRELNARLDRAASSLAAIDAPALAQEAHRLSLLAVAKVCDPAQSASTVEAILAALRDGRQNDPCWGVFGVPGQDVSVLRQVAARIRRLPPEDLEVIDRQGWLTFVAACDRQKSMLDTARARSSGDPLPALELAGVLNTSETLGSLAARLVVSPASSPHVGRTDWWDAMFAGLTVSRRSGFRSPMDREESGIALLQCYALPDSRSAINAALDNKSREVSAR